ncbi:hypothetical protein [Pseudobacteriovorax antillogorgiicola]|uniref:Uncharacterized protein n=1 Tax=Pseudobacteriovorax antillogorgiicola TaxID=1513793 RepID=A0A1Y6CU60_9BACT|nr:hypothetical protein [Pseudobacteriovorax antillogorgiicola]TCS44806.1 hypothetical protein EDD56_13135 [Pseudobacteriovorax antillogorgiicola]SMF77318.1 hypothetical protein SAMN06296036_13129 [Pseudobacteriovorax antillogorgiicola]
MRYYLPYPDISGAVQGKRLILQGPREQIYINLDHSDRNRVIEGLSFFSQKPEHDSCQWLLHKLAHLPVCFVSSKLTGSKKRLEIEWIKFEHWANSDDFTCRSRWFSIFLDPIPFYTKFRYFINSFRFPETPLENAFAKDPSTFMKIAKLTFAQSKYLATRLESFYDSEASLPRHMETMITDMQAYVLTVEGSMSALDLNQGWDDLVLKETKKVFESFEQAYKRRSLHAYLVLEVIERAIYLDDHPIKTLLQKMFTFKLFQRDYLTVDLDQGKSDGIFTLLSDTGRIPIGHGRRMIEESLSVLELFMSQQDLIHNQVIPHDARRLG